ncbi:hypothetical protein FRC10_010011 [Ceratobasidium sp. 414]|nr:hypothetical protein FRC10_010011 [Ceratobasidium sp. 414]
MPPHDVENADRQLDGVEQITADERSPLIQPAVGDDVVPGVEQKPHTWGWYAWRVFWALLGISILTVFIKGWIDADDIEFDLKVALKKALGGGLSGAAGMNPPPSMVLQVATLMPLRTIMNYQYRFGTSFTVATRTLYQDGGVRRYYQGVGAALIQGWTRIFTFEKHLITLLAGPVSRFGDTAANAGILALLQSNSYLSKLPAPVKTIFASACAAAFRILLTPIDTLKTTLQAQGARGTALLRQRIKANGITSLWWGALATAAATFVGHYPWFATYNYLTEIITEPPKHPLFPWLLRLAFIGFCASVVSDTVSNSLRVVKTYRQVNDTRISYSEAARAVVLTDGIKGLLGRGLKTRILANGLQGLMFSILWKFFLDLRIMNAKNPVAALQAGIENKLAFISTDPINWQGLVLAFSWGVWAFESYLIFRQYPNYSRPTPPAALKEHFTEEVFQKSQRYGRDKARFQVVSKLYSQLLETGMIVFGAFPWAWSTAGDVLTKFGYGPEYEITQSIVFGTILFLLTSIPNIPVSLYSTFVLEEKHGFNKTTPGLFVADTLKGWAVGFAIGAPFMAGFLKIVGWAGSSFIPWLMTFLVAFQLSMVVLYPTVIQPLFNKLSPLEAGLLRTRIESLAERLKFPLTDLYVIDGSKRSAHSNAYFYGLPWSKHIVLFDTLIKKSQPAELEAVLAHELGHWKYSHPMKLMIVSQVHLLALFALFPPFMRSWPLLASFGFPVSATTKPPTLVSFLLYQMVITPVESVISFLMNALSRRFEYQADQFACELDARGLAGEKEEGKSDEESTMRARLSRALVGLHVENLSTVWVDWMYSAYHHSHPTLTERLRAMELFAGSEKGRPKMGVKERQGWNGGKAKTTRPQ